MSTEPARPWLIWLPFLFAFFVFSPCMLIDKTFLFFFALSTSLSLKSGEIFLWFFAPAWITQKRTWSLSPLFFSVSGSSFSFFSWERKTVQRRTDSLYCTSSSITLSYSIIIPSQLTHNSSHAAVEAVSTMTHRLQTTSSGERKKRKPLVILLVPR